MKMKKKILPAVLLSLMFQAAGVNAERLAKENVHGNADTNAIEQNAALDEIQTYQYFNDACAAYEFARMETDAGKRSQFYGDAVTNIANIIATDAENGEAFLLALQIYRAKGGLTYAERYLKRADDIFYCAAQTHPQSIAANLDYAVFCYATSLTSKLNQENKALAYADKTLKLIEAQRKMQADEQTKSYLRYEALAYLVKGDSRTCEKLLAVASDYDQQSEKYSGVDGKDAASIAYDRKHTTANIFYHSLFEDTVMQQKWLWPVAAKNVAKEFLLYYLTDLSRNETYDMFVYK